VAPPGNTPLPPLPGAGGVVHNAGAQVNPWAAARAAEGAGPGGPVPGGFRPNVPAAPGAVPPPGVGASGVPGAPAMFGGAMAPPAPPIRPRLVDRAPTWVLVASAVVVLALIAGAVFVITHRGDKYPSHWDPRVEGLTKWVEHERGLDFEHPVKVNFLSPKEYTARSTSDMGTDQTPKDALADQVAELRALGFVTGDVDLSAAGDALADSGTLAYYDPSVEEVFVRGTSMTPGVRVTLAHELTHVLQDQHFDLERLESLEDGRGSMLRALAEGDATLVEEEYKADDKVFSKADAKAYDEETKRDSDAGEEAMKDVPPILQTMFAAPYILGPTLVRVLVVDAIGTKAAEGPLGPGADKYTEIDRVLDDPPTEEVLFDPITYGSDAAKAKTVAQAAPEGSKTLDEGEFGPTAWYLLLATRVDAKVALEATDGWGGDHFVTYKKDDKVCVDATIEGDSDADVLQMGSALSSWVGKSPEGTATAKTEGGKVAFHACDPGKDAKAAGSDASTDLLNLPVTRSQIFADVWATTGDRKVAACFAGKLVERATAAQLNDEQYFNSGDGVTLAQRTISECR
jgi:hypothetical protein